MKTIVLSVNKSNTVELRCWYDIVLDCSACILGIFGSCARGEWKGATHGELRFEPPMYSDIRGCEYLIQARTISNGRVSLKFHLLNLESTYQIDCRSSLSVIDTIVVRDKVISFMPGKFFFNDIPSSHKLKHITYFKCYVGLFHEHKKVR